jgi:hypothetical protein
MFFQSPRFVTGLHPMFMLQAPTNPEADCDIVLSDDSAYHTIKCHRRDTRKKKFSEELRA